MLSIRPAKPTDGGLVYALIRELAEYERLTHLVEASEGDITGELFGSRPRIFCDIAEWQGQPVGFALWFYTFSTFKGRCGIYLEDLFVRPEHRGHGIGKGLLHGLAKRCADEKLGRLEWAVLDWNAPSIAFYESLGATPQDGWTVYRLTGDALETLEAREKS